MMTNKPNTVQSLNDLKAEIRLVKSRIKARETDLEKRWEKFPEESLKATMGAVLPAFINDRIAGGTWQILRAIGSFLFDKHKQGEAQPYWKELLASSVNKFSLSAILKLILGFVKR
ncbi:hypothetical protein ACFOW1_03970 [Parasediminibacterium paludis]|uniref:Uncharacterized protein n=1 Tax=Parasediminibacterium paludis TaxID=908966 RepID=A0ABV8PT20_9BACT